MGVVDGRLRLVDDLPARGDDARAHSRSSTAGSVNGCVVPDAPPDARGGVAEQDPSVVVRE